MAEAESKKKNRKVRRARVTKFANELDRLLSVTEPILADIRLAWESLQTAFEELQTYDKELYSILLEAATEEELLEELDGCDVYSKRFTTLRLKYESFYDSNKETRLAGGNRSKVYEVPGKRKFKLPLIQFKQYDGSIRDWLQFWAQFKKVHQDSNIDDCDKIEYLILATCPGSRARQLVESFPIVGENYTKIIDCMKSKFGRDDLQIE